MKAVRPTPVTKPAPKASAAIAAAKAPASATPAPAAGPASTQAKLPPAVPFELPPKAPEAPPAAPAKVAKPRRRKGQPKPEPPELDGAKWKKGFKPKKVKAADPLAPIAPISSANSAPVVADEPLVKGLGTIPSANRAAVVEDHPVAAILPIPSAQKGRVVADDPLRRLGPIKTSPKHTLYLDEDGTVMASVPPAPKGVVYLDAEPIFAGIDASRRQAEVRGRSPPRRTARRAAQPAEPEASVPQALASAVEAAQAAEPQRMPVAAPDAAAAQQPAASEGDAPATAAAPADAPAPEPVAPAAAPALRLPIRLDLRSLTPVQVVEAILFSAGKPVAIEEMHEQTGLDKQALSKAVKELQKAYAERDTVLEVEKAGTKWAMQVRSRAAEPAARFAPMEIAPKLLKTLALIAYHQPVRQSELVEMLGTKVYDHVPELVERGLVKAREEGVTKILSTTSAFPEYFGLDASTPDEIRATMARIVGLDPNAPRRSAPAPADGQATLDAPAKPEQAPSSQATGEGAEAQRLEQPVQAVQP